MTRFATALGLAALAHVVAFALAARLLPRGTPPPPAPELQVTTVELSFAEHDEAEGLVGASAFREETPTPDPPEVAQVAEPMPELSVRDDGPMPAAPRARVEASRLEPSLPEAPPSEVGVAEEKTRETARVDVPPQPRAAFRPVYPRRCRARGEEGVVTLEIEVSAGGFATSVTVGVSSGFPELDAAAVAAVRRAGFCPATRDGRPIAGMIRLPVSFRLR